MAIQEITIFEVPTDSTVVTGIPSNTQKRFNGNVKGFSESIADFNDVIVTSGDFRKLTGMRVLINSIKNALTTPKGSYPFDPEFGSNLYQKVFDLADEITAEEIENEVVDVIRYYDDRVRITEVITEFYRNQKGFRINVYIQKLEGSIPIQLDFSEEEAAFALEQQGGE